MHWSFDIQVDRTITVEVSPTSIKSASTGQSKITYCFFVPKGMKEYICIGRSRSKSKYNVLVHSALNLTYKIIIKI